MQYLTQRSHPHGVRLHPLESFRHGFENLMRFEDLSIRDEEVESQDRIPRWNELGLHHALLAFERAAS
jgi:hypothetical protein